MPKKIRRKTRRKEPELLGRSPAALFRFAVNDVETREALDAKILGKVKPTDLARDGGALVDQAEGPAELVQLLPQLRRSAIRAWERRTRTLPAADAAPLLGELLDELYGMTDGMQREHMYDAVLGTLRWMEAPGAEVLQSRFDSLPPSAASRASVSLGLLGCADAAERLRRFYFDNREGTSFDYSGALWGLLDLKDPELSDLLAQEFTRRSRLPELLDLCCLGGDQRVVPALLLELHEAQLKGQEGREALEALYVVFWRCGKEGFLASATEAGITTETLQPLVDVLERSPPDPDQLAAIGGGPTSTD